MEPLLGTIIMFAGNFAPRGWALCQGQLLAISSNTALFSILGTTYGGDGRTTFGLPDLRGRAPVQQGSGPGLSNRTLGQRGGVEQVTLSQAQLPVHSHAATATQNVVAGAGDSNAPSGRIPAGLVRETAYSSLAADAQLSAGSVDVTVQNAGSGQAVDTLSPYLAINFIIALQGIFPSRN